MKRRRSRAGSSTSPAVPPGKQELAKITQFQHRRALKAGVKIAMGEPVTPELVAAMRPDVLVVATGATAKRPLIPGADGANVLTAHDVLAGAVDVPPGNVLVIGGGMVGCETASFLANTGDNITIGRTSVTIVEMTEAVAADMFSEGRELLMEKLRHKEVRVVTSATVKEITADGAGGGARGRGGGHPRHGLRGARARLGSGERPGRRGGRGRGAHHRRRARAAAGAGSHPRGRGAGPGAVKVPLAFNQGDSTQDIPITCLP